MVEVPLTNGGVALIDDEDAALVTGRSWRRLDSGNGLKSYATTNIKGRSLSMHRFVMDAQPGQTIDHRDRNGLNNQRENLRFATPAQNVVNSPSRRGSRSQYKGVYWNKQRQAWHARIFRDGEQCHLGTFETEEAAARAYNAAALNHHGEFARPNIVPGTGAMGWLLEDLALDETETQIARLQIDQGLARHEAAKIVGISPIEAERIWAGIGKKVSAYQEALQTSEPDEESAAELMKARPGSCCYRQYTKVFK